MTERRALVVEVDAATQLGLLGFLRARGFQCVAASSSDEAQDALVDNSFSFTLVDLSGNGGDVTELMECLKLRGRNSEPIIAVSNSHDDGLAGVPIEAEAMLHKPLSLDELQQAIDKTLREVLSRAQQDKVTKVWTVTVDSENVIAALNRRLATIDGTLPQISRAKNTITTYEIANSAYEALRGD